MPRKKKRKRQPEVYKILAPFLPDVLIDLTFQYTHPMPFVVLGGADKGYMSIASCEIFKSNDDDIGHWEFLPSLPQPLSGAYCGSFQNKLYLIGGRTLDSRSKSCYMLDFSIKTPTWVSMAEMSIIRQWPGGWIYNEQIYIYGGISPEFDRLSCGEVYDIKKNMWYKLKTKLRIPCARFITGVIGDRLYKFGGLGARSFVIECEYYYPLTEEWISLESMPSTQSTFCTGTLIGHEFYLFSSNEIGIYDTAKNKWTRVSTTNKDENHETGTNLSVYEGKIVSCGLTCKTLDPVLQTKKWSIFPKCNLERRYASSCTIELIRK